MPGRQQRRHHHLPAVGALPPAHLLVDDVRLLGEQLFVHPGERIGQPSEDNRQQLVERVPGSDRPVGGRLDVGLAVERGGAQPTSRENIESPFASGARKTRCSSVCARPCLPAGSSTEPTSTVSTTPATPEVSSCSMTTRRPLGSVCSLTGSRWRGGGVPAVPQVAPAIAAIAKINRRRRVTCADQLRLYMPGCGPVGGPLIESSSMSNTSMPLGAPGRGELS